MLVERHLAGDDLVAAMMSPSSASERVATHLHRPAAPARRPQHQRVLRESRRAFMPKPPPTSGETTRIWFPACGRSARRPMARAMRVLRGVERVAVAVGMVIADRGARLHRVGGEPVVPDPQRHDVLGAGERRVGRLLVAEHQREADIAGRLVPDLRRPRLDRVLGSPRPATARNRPRPAPRRRAPGAASRHHEGDAVADARTLSTAAVDRCESPSARRYPRASAA